MIAVEMMVSRLEAGDTLRNAAAAPIPAVAPFMLFVMATILLPQLQSFSRLFLVVAIARWL